MTHVLLWLFLCEQKKKFGFDIYCNKMHMYCLKIAEKILCIANAHANQTTNLLVCTISETEGEVGAVKLV